MGLTRHYAAAAPSNTDNCGTERPNCPLRGPPKPAYGGGGVPPNACEFRDRRDEVRDLEADAARRLGLRDPAWKKRGSIAGSCQGASALRFPSRSRACS